MGRIVEMIVGFRRSGAMLIPEGSTGDLIRCKDCKNRERIDENRYCCKAEVIVYDMDRGPNNGEWYCADGERKDDDTL